MQYRAFTASLTSTNAGTPDSRVTSENVSRLCSGRVLWGTKPPLVENQYVRGRRESWHFFGGWSVPEACAAGLKTEGVPCTVPRRQRAPEM